MVSDVKFIPENLPAELDFHDLPWELPIDRWDTHTPRLEEVQRGISRHPVVFANYNGSLFAIKEMPEDLAKKEYDLLIQMKELSLPSVKPYGYAKVIRKTGNSSILITHYLDTSIPYRYLFINNAIEHFQFHLLDAIAGLLVQLHSNGFYWGDCSLSNILFRRDAGALQAYLVDAETAEYHLPPIPPMLRYHDLEIMQENVLGELIDLQVSENLSLSYPVRETGPYIQQQYRSLWEEISREDLLSQDELYRVQERIRSLNEMGFSVKDIQLKHEDHSNSVKLRIFVSDRNFHRNQLMEITGLYAEDRQAQQIINEIHELRAHLSQSVNPDITLEATAFYWLEHTYKPVIDQLKPLIKNKKNPKFNRNPVELYCQILEHKWYLSERSRRDVGHQAAVEDFINQFG
jgi:tRNA A-37 threonylcarbamoyl transferase component Bud32